MQEKLFYMWMCIMFVLFSECEKFYLKFYTYMSTVDFSINDWLIPQVIIIMLNTLVKFQCSSERENEAGPEHQSILMVLTHSRYHI